MGIPVICNDIGDTGRIIEETGTGIMIKEFSEVEYRTQVKKIDEIMSISKDHIRQSAYRYFDLDAGVAKYLEIYKRVLKN